MLKVGIVSSVRPETNYTAYLEEALQTRFGGEAQIFPYCEKGPENNEVGLANLRPCWNRDWRYFFQIISQAQKDKLHVLHFQHEINMFGGPRTAVIFPFLVLFSSLFGFRPVVTIHAAVPVKEFNADFLKVFEWPRPDLLAPLVRVIFPTIYFLIGLFAQKIIVHSPGIKKTLEKDYKISGAKIVVIPHGVPENVSYSKELVSRSIKEEVEGKKFVLYFGYFHRRKGLGILIRAFAKLANEYPDIYLVLGGGTILPSYSKEMADLVSKLCLEKRVIITGFLSLNDLRFLLTLCEFVVLPAIYSIAASGPLAQVFAHHKPVIVTDLGVYHEEITDGVNGLFCQVGSIASLKEKMELLLVNESLRQSLSGNVAQLARERGWGEIAGKTIKVYEQVCHL